MINRIIEFSLKNRFIIIAACALVAGWGYWALVRTPIDAIPDLSDNQVIVFTDWVGRSPQEVEDQVTYPLSTALQGMPGVRSVRGQSAFGFSMINVIFEDSVDLYWARTRVLERLNLITAQLPAGVAPTLGPDASGVGQIFWYTVEGQGYNLRDLRSLQDWFIRYQLNSVPGVAEVASVGGHVQQYQIDVDPNRLRAYSIPLSQVIEAVERSNSNVGGNVVEQGGQWSVVRGVGLIESMADIENIVIGAANGTPVYVRNVAEVKLGNAFRVGALDRDGKEAVGGVVIARYGVNALDVIEGVKEKLKSLESGLPKGVKITPFYDRTELILRATDTLKRALIEELLLVTLAHIVFLFHFRSILIVTIPLPLAVLMSFLFMHYLGISSNLMSLAGIAIAIGVLVDAGIVVTENAFRQVEKHRVDPRDRSRVWQTVFESTRLVGRPIFFSMTIIVLAFIPVFALTGREGKLFHPLAFTKTFAMIGATIIAVTLVPVLCTLLLGGRFHSEDSNIVMRALHRIYRPALRLALAHRVMTILLAAALFGGALYLATRIGSEFMPELNEGDLMYMPITDPAISIDEALRVMQMQDETLKSFPEVEWVVGKAGRAETSTDPAPVNMNETIAHLKPPAEWRPGMTREKLIAEMDAKLAMPGVQNIWTQPIINRIEMLTTGIRTQIGVKIFGSDLNELERLSHEVAAALRGVAGAANVSPEPLTGAPYIDIEINRQAAARYGIDVKAIQDVIDKGIGETNLTVTIEGRKRFPARVRYAPEFRTSPDALGQLVVPAPNGAQIPLSQLASIRSVQGASMIPSESGLLRGAVLLNVRGRDVIGFVEEAKKILNEKVALPPGYYFEWAGQYQDQQRARARLQLVLPIVLLVIFVLLYFTYHSLIEAAHVLMAVPFALTGGVCLLYAMGYNFSVAVWVGFIALFGTAVQTGMVMVIYLNEAVERKKAEMGRLTRQSLLEAVMEGAVLRLRPKVMTVSTVVAGLLPIMWSASAGAEVMKPLATPVLGGMVSSLIHVLIVTPVIFYWLREREIKREMAKEKVETNCRQDFNDPPTAVGGIQKMFAVLVLLLFTASNALAQSVSAPWAANADQNSTYAQLIDPAKGMTVDDLVRYALEHNGELQAARQMIAEARGRLRQAGLKPNPMLEASGTQAVNGPDNNLTIGVELPLELGGRRKARVAVAEREVEMREAEVRDFERRLAAEVRMKYTEAIAQARNLKFTEEQLNLTRNSYRLIRARVELGKSAPLDQNLVWVELNKSDAMRIGFESKAEIAMFELKKVIGMPPGEDLRLHDDFELRSQPPPSRDALRLALESRPDLAALRAAESIAAAQAEQARVKGKIDASVFAGYQRMNFGYDIRGFNAVGALTPVTGVFHMATFGVRLTLPTRNKNQGLIEAAIAAEEAARKRREFAEMVARNEVAAAYARLERAQAAEAIYRDRVRETALSNLDALRKAYALGRNNLLDYIAEQRRLIEVEIGYTDLLKDRLNALIEIERAAGLPLLPAEPKIKVEN